MQINAASISLHLFTSSGSSDIILNAPTVSVSGAIVGGRVYFPSPAENVTWDSGGVPLLNVDPNHSLTLTLPGDDSIDLTNQGTATVNPGTGTVLLNAAGSGITTVNLVNGAPMH